MKAYLDIETSFGGEITVIGVFRPPDRLVQLVGDEAHWTNLWNALDGVAAIFTYNGDRFDLPVIKRALRFDLKRFFDCRDLMYDCWRKDLYGGLKRVEEQLGIERSTRGVDGWAAMRLWDQFRRYREEDSLKLLLAYNREDVVNLHHLEGRLELIAAPQGAAGPRGRKRSRKTSAP